MSPSVLVGKIFLFALQHLLETIPSESFVYCLFFNTNLDLL